MRICGEFSSSTLMAVVEIQYKAVFHVDIVNNGNQALKRLGIDLRDRMLISNLYIEQTMQLRIESDISEPRVTGRGSRQGCPLSPLFSTFTVY